MQNTYDVAIVGGGVMGSAIAYFLTADPAFDGSVLVVERDPAYSACATTRSWGGIRQQFSTPENVRMGLFGAEFVKSAAERLEVDGEAPDLGFVERGYLFLASPAGLPVLEDNCRLQQSLGAAVERLDPDALAARYPWLGLEGIAGATIGSANEGWLAPDSLLQAFKRKARALGAAYLEDEAVGVVRAGQRITGLRCRGAGEIGCRHLVNAAGPRAGAFADLAGVELPVRPRKRMTYVFDCRSDLSDAPLTIDPTGVVFRPESGQYLTLVSPPADRDPDSDDLEPEYSLFEEVIWPRLAARVPAFEAIKLVGAWAGHYDYNSFDQNAIIGPHPEIEGLMFCNGFSGHGVQQSPAAGRALAELIAHGRFVSLDLSAFSYDRLAADRPVVEANVL